MRNVWRSALCAGVGLVAVAGSMVPAQASPNRVSGTFHYVDLIAGAEKNENPEVGVCYSTPTFAMTADNETNARVFMYADHNCVVIAEALEPGNSTSNIFFSYRFDNPR